MAVKKRYLIPSIIALAALIIIILLFTLPVNLPDDRDYPIFTLADKTEIYAVNIKQQSEGDSFIQSLNIPYGVRSFDVVFFDEPILNRSKKISLPITFYGKEYTAELTRIMDRPNGNYSEDSVEVYGAKSTGIDENGNVFTEYIDIVSYSGYIKGLDNSIMIVTAGEGNDFIGSIQFDGKYISITTAGETEDGKYAEIVYCENNNLQPSYGDMILITLLSKKYGPEM
ncbi:MAG: hypothetical protein Q4Q53_02030 [Methanocorpusculum sp.]|nr:hypothetical protein [Methanocorpusculum sp.]